MQKACRKKKGGNKKVQQKGHEETKALTVVTEEGDSETEFLTMYPVVTGYDYVIDYVEPSGLMHY